MAEKKLKEYIVSFRIPKDQATIVSKMLVDQPILGVKSVNQFFRKIGRDHLAGRLAYKNPEHASTDTDIMD
jgi:hypothetical protein